jgi:probable selenium-dependent hydroxylase accessory protein YqeC
LCLPYHVGVSSPIADAFEVGPREVITLVGGSGKTTALYRLARELHQRDGGRGVVVTTTTHIFAPPPEPDLKPIVEPEPEIGLSRCLAALTTGRIPVLGTRLTPDGKLAGVAPEVVDACAARAEVHHVVVEADGSAHKPFKAPLEYEPVVPATTTLLVAVVGVDALGQPLNAEHIHRPQRVAELGETALDAPLTADAIARVLVHPAGPLRDLPNGARALILLNKADTPERCAAARRIADAIQARRGPPTLIGAVAAEVPFEQT